MIEVTCAIIVKRQKILITQNGEDSDHPFEWEFPGGKTEPGEKAEDCIAREIREELDVEIEVVKRLNPVVFDYGIKTIKLIPFICNCLTGKIHLKEHIDFKWIKFEGLKEIKFSGADKQLINEPGNYSILKEYIGEQMNKTG